MAIAVQSVLRVSVHTRAHILSQQELRARTPLLSSCNIEYCAAYILAMCMIKTIQTVSQLSHVLQ